LTNIIDWVFNIFTIKEMVIFHPFQVGGIWPFFGWSSSSSVPPAWCGVH
jgi:hypothetical protein